MLVSLQLVVVLHWWAVLWHSGAVDVDGLSCPVAWRATVSVPRNSCALGTSTWPTDPIPGWLFGSGQCSGTDKGDCGPSIQ